MHVFTPYWDNVTEGQICNKVITLLLPLSRKVAQKSVMLLFWCALNLKMQKPSLSFSIGICNCKNQWYLKSKLIYIVLSSEKLLLQRKIISFFIFKRKNIGCKNFRSTFRAVEVKMNFQNQILWWVPSLLPEGLLTLSPFSIIYGPKYEGWQTNGLKSDFLWGGRPFPFKFRKYCQRRQLIGFPSWRRKKHFKTLGFICFECWYYFMGDGRDGRAEWRHCWVCCEPVFQFTWLRLFLFSPRWYKLCPADLQNPYSFLMLAPKYYSDLFAYFPHILISKKQNASERIKILSTFKVYRIFR